MSNVTVGAPVGTNLRRLPKTWPLVRVTEPLEPTESVKLPVETMPPDRVSAPFTVMLAPRVTPAASVIVRPENVVAKLPPSVAAADPLSRIVPVPGCERGRGRVVDPVARHVERARGADERSGGDRDPSGSSRGVGQRQRAGAGLGQRTTAGDDAGVGEGQAGVDAEGAVAGEGDAPVGIEGEAGAGQQRAAREGDLAGRGDGRCARPGWRRRPPTPCPR